MTCSIAVGYSQPGQALVVGLETCRALDAAHQKGLFHTELTPSKMVFGADRRLRVVDFGMARLLAESAWADASAVPTHVARYASPEQALGLPIDAKTDVYALALVMIEAVTGAVPFAADSTVATLTGRVDKLLPVSADLGSLASVLERAGRPESADRFTAAEFGRALVQAAPGLPKPEPIPILATGTFDTTAMRRPSDPTGGVERPPPVAGLAGVDETGTPNVAGAAVVAATGVAAAAAATGAVGHASDHVAAGVAAGAEPPDPDSERESESDSEEIQPAGRDADDAVPVEAGAVEDDTAPAAAASKAEPATDPDNDAESAPADDSVVETVDTESEDTDASDVAAVGPLTALDDDLKIIEEPLADDDTMAAAAEVPEVAGVATEAVLAPPPGTSTLAATTVVPTVAASVEDETIGELYDDEAGRRRRGPVILLVLLLLAGLGALGYAGSLLLQTKSFEVPVLAGVPEDEALNQIAGNGWEIDTLRERSDSFPQLDTVIRTIPGPGVELDEGDPFTLVLSDGPEFRDPARAGGVCRSMRRSPSWPGSASTVSRRPSGCSPKPSRPSRSSPGRSKATPMAPCRPAPRSCPVRPS